MESRLTLQLAILWTRRARVHSSMSAKCKVIMWVLYVNHRLSVYLSIYLSKLFFHLSLSLSLYLSLFPSPSLILSLFQLLSQKYFTLSKQKINQFLKQVQITLLLILIIILLLLLSLFYTMFLYITFHFKTSVNTVYLHSLFKVNHIINRHKIKIIFNILSNVTFKFNQRRIYITFSCQLTNSLFLFSQ